LGVLLAVVVVLGVFVFRVPQKLGLVQPPAERLLAGAPDRSTGQAIRDEVAKGGIDVKGMEVYVLPIAGKQISVAYAVLDASKGFRFTKVQGQDPILEYMKRLATTDTVRQEGIERVAIEYRDKKGKVLLTLTATTEAITGFARGAVTREQLIQKIDGNADWPAFYQEVF
jgi:hypothetical protein